MWRRMIIRWRRRVGGRLVRSRTLCSGAAVDRALLLLGNASVHSARRDAAWQPGTGTATPLDLCAGEAVGYEAYGFSGGGSPAGEGYGDDQVVVLALAGGSVFWFAGAGGA